MEIIIVIIIQTHMKRTPKKGKQLKKWFKFKLIIAIIILIFFSLVVVVVVTIIIIEK